jgi:hypothetical protein
MLPYQVATSDATKKGSVNFLPAKMNSKSSLLVLILLSIKGRKPRNVRQK